MAIGPRIWPAVTRMRARLAPLQVAQRMALARILADIAPSPYGRACGLTSSMTLDDLAALPATDDAGLRPFVERLATGEQRATTVAGAVGLVRTAGTTGPARVLPMTAMQRADLLAFARRLLLGQLRAGGSPLPRLSRWLLVTASTRTDTIGGLPVGYASGLLQNIVRRAWPAFALPDPDIAEPESREERLDRLVAVTRGARVGTLFGVPADLAALLERLTGVVGRPAGEVWPDLEEVYWIGTHLGTARSRIERLVGRPLAFREVYGAAEGAFGADWLGTGHLALLPGRTVFGFEPLGGSGRTGRRVLLHELVDAPVGARFELLVTTAAGLVQYRVGDVVEVTGHRPLGIAVVGRVDERLSVAGEALVPREACAALAALAEGRGIAVDDWLVSPAGGQGAGEPPRHRWVLELAAPAAHTPVPGRVEVSVAHALDRALRQAAPAYDRVRREGRLGPPDVIVVSRDAFDRYRAAAWPPGSPRRARPFARSWAEVLARPGMGPALARLG